MEELKNCPACNSEDVYLQPGHDGWVHCNECDITAHEEAWQAPRKRVEELEADLAKVTEVCDEIVNDLDEDLYNSAYQRAQVWIQLKQEGN